MAQLQALDPAALIWGTTKRKVKSGADGGPPQIEVTQAAKPHIYLTLLHLWDKRLTDIAAEMIRLGLMERLTFAAEAEGAHLADVIQGALDDLHLSAEQKAMAPAIVTRRIRELTSRQAEPAEVVQLSDRSRRRPGPNVP